MSSSLTNVTRVALIGIAVALEIGVISRLIVVPPANLADMLGSLEGLLVFFLHVVASALLAAGVGGFLPGGSVSDRASVVMLYFIIAFILPGAGICGVAMLGMVLGRGGKATEGEAPFGLGNPLTMRRDRPRTPNSAHLEPIAHSLRGFDTYQARAAVLALRHRADRPEVAALLRRFRHDPDSELQFFAGGALDGAVERNEARANAFAKRVHDDPKDADAHAGIAAGLLKTARSAVPAERRRLATAAAEHVAAARGVRPGSIALVRLAARAALLADDHDTASELLAEQALTSPERLELLHRRRDWSALRELALGDTGVAESNSVLAFWAGAKEGGAA